MKKLTKTLLIGTLVLPGLPAFAQEPAKEDTLQKTLEGMQSDIKNLKKLKITGYIQAQAQFADSNGIPSVAGGAFGTNTDKRFMVRRGRVKFTYDNTRSQYVLQIDVTQSGVAIKDAYAKFLLPRSKALAATIGCFDRPFGYEIGYSSSSRETPERGRMSQVIFPGERDLGAMLTFQMPKTSKWNMLKIDAGMFNGTGPTAMDFDYQKDFIGRIRIDKTSKSEKVTMGLGASVYSGGWRQNTSTVYAMNGEFGVPSFRQNKDSMINYGSIARRQYGGMDAQLGFDFPFGMTTLRGEYIAGQQPGTSTSSSSPSAQPTTDTYFRDFNGAYFYFIQNLGQSKHQVVVKYDWYDPNVDVEGDDIGKALTGTNGIKYTSTGIADLKYTTIGIGWTYRLDANVKIVAYYDMVKNETSLLLNGVDSKTKKYNRANDFTQDMTDNVFTLRVQYKF